MKAPNKPLLPEMQPAGERKTARLVAKSLEVELCIDCGVNAAVLPSKLCPTCANNREALDSAGADYFEDELITQMTKRTP